MNYAGGGKVSKSVTKLRRERLLDENPGIDRIINPSKLDYLLGTSNRPLINLEPEEYLGLALDIGPNYSKVFKSESNRLAKDITQRNPLIELPDLDIHWKVPEGISKDTFAVASHDGRHRAQVLGDKGYKVPTTITIPDASEYKSASEAANWLNNKKIAKDIGFTSELEYWKWLEKHGLGTGVFEVKGRAFADGGPVDDYELEDMLRQSDQLYGFERFVPSTDVIHYLKKGLATNIGDVDEKGHLKASLKGFGDSVLSLGALPALLDVILPRAPFKGSDLVPEWAWKADERKGKVRERVKELTRRHGDSPVMDAVGEMVTQVPLPVNALKGAKFLQNAPKVAKPVIKVGGSTLEYLSPTVDPTLGNYMKGSAAGSVFNELTDEDVESELERIMQEAEDLPQPKRGGMADWYYAGGGKVGPLIKGMGAKVQELKNLDPAAVDNSYVARLHKYARFRGITLDDAAAEMIEVHKSGAVRTANAVKALKDAISHINNKDRTSAIRALTSSGIHDDPDIQEVMRLLRGPPQAQSKARATMDRAVAEDTDSTIMPLMGP